MDHIIESGAVLQRIMKQGGLVFESNLPQNDLIMFRLMDKQFIKPMVDTDQGCLFAITQQGVDEAERVGKLRDN
jgi:hypothetical protein